MKIEEFKTLLELKLPGIAFKQVRDSLLVENPSDLPKVAFFLKNSDLEIDYLSSVTGSDYLDYLESVYHLYSTTKKTGLITLRVRVKRDAPNVPSLVPIYRSAEFQEREAYDMYGIIYEGHPDLRRLFMWEGFEGFPMRKDYIQEDSEWLEPEDLEWLEKHQVPVTEEMKERAKTPRIIKKDAGE
ncbi:MAG: NADH-quinone oxidoreductase subunit C [Candidatus Omnitrophica bacterium]|nr:NADH-quinone oxidoreductase subunit C [Candidatus Omnitrophota bacterium]